MKGAQLVLAVLLTTTVALASQSGASVAEPFTEPVAPAEPTTSVAETTTTSSTTTTTVVTRKDIRVFYNVQVKKRVVFITIDDGGFMSRDAARYINQNKIPITSFILPEPLVKRWDQFDLVRSQTYENHSNTHGRMRRMTFAQQKEEICRANTIIRRKSGREPAFFRPPGGGFNAITKKAMAACGVRYLAMWNVVADDGVVRTPGSRQLLPGDIILMHYKQSMTGSLKKLMAQLKRQNLKPALLRDYVQYPD
jgi:peptidoglycan/xylan/chitin deacetylase (PgdA/CDA1 family)